MIYRKSRNEQLGANRLMSLLKRALVSACLALTVSLAMATAASAKSPAIDLTFASPDSVEAGKTAAIQFGFFSGGDEPLAGELTVTETVSPGLTLPTKMAFQQASNGTEVNPDCQSTALTLTCKLVLPKSLPPGVQLYFSDTQGLAVSPSASGDLAVEFEVSGGGAAPVSDRHTIAVGSTSYGIASWGTSLLDRDGSLLRQGGFTPAHFVNTLRPVNTSFLLAGVVPGLGPLEQLKDAIAHIPPGLIGNPQAIPRCTMARMTAYNGRSAECPPQSQVGVFRGGISNITRVLPLYNVEPPTGSPARLAFNYQGVVVQFLARLRPDDYGIDVASIDTSTTLVINDGELDIWGTPSDSSHDSVRGKCIESGGMDGATGESCPSAEPRTAFLRTPTSCDGSPLSVGIDVTTYAHPDVVHKATAEMPPMSGCDRIPFDPSMEVQPTAHTAESPTGLAVHVETPNPGLENPDGIASSDVKAVEVTLPLGVTANPSQAEGLGVCRPAQYESTELSFHPDGTKGCPSDSKIGTVLVKTQLLEDPLEGEVYLAQQDDPSTAQPGAENPFDSLLALYVVITDPQQGILITLPGKVETDEQTGRLVTTFDDLPQQPFSSFDFKFREGARAPLVTPPNCGTYTTKAVFTPWSDPSRRVSTSSSFEITAGVGDTPCPSGGVPPFRPGFTAGSINNNAGSYSPFYMRLTRQDGDQDMTKFSSVLPPGVSAKIAGVEKCSEAAIAAAKGKTGRQELASPSCPASSQIGRLLAGAGVGSVLTYVGGKLYFAGPYQGAPLSVVAVTPAVAGPFDIGTVVVREALTLDPVTAEVHVDGEKSDPIPHILKGIPLKVRDLRVYVDRPDFTINPTSCDPSEVGATLFGSFLDVLSPADDVPVALASRFQAANCSSLGFKPKLSIKLKGGTKRGGHPALRAVVTPRPGDANISDAVVKLPRSAFLDQAHIRTICTRVQFAARACPPGAIYGHVKAWTPLLDEPLEGPVYLRSSNNKLPDLVFDLHGIVDIEVAGRIDSVKGGIRTSFEAVPDAPVSKVILEMQGGKKGLVVNSKNLCASTNRANASFTGQNGKLHSFRSVVKPACKQRRNAKRAPRRR